MEKSSVLIILLTVAAAFAVFNYSPKQDNEAVQEMYQYKIEFDNFKHEYNRVYDVDE
jgi:hypothetical protein